MIRVDKGPSNKIKSDSYSLYVKSDNFDQVFTDKIKVFPIRHYDASHKSWELPVTCLPTLLKNFKDIVVSDGLDGYNIKKFETLDQYKEYLKSIKPRVDFSFKTIPDPAQLEFFNEMLDRNRILLADPPGFGKTKEYLDVCEYRKIHSEYMKILFICKSKHKYNMAREIKLHTNSKYAIIEDELDNRLQVLRDYYIDPTLYYLIISYEMAEFHTKELKEIGREIGFDGIIVDEFTKLKNWAAGMSEKGRKRHITINITNLVEVLNPELLILGSGTPLEKVSTNLYAPLRLTKTIEDPANIFKMRFCRTDHWGNIIGSKNTDELRQLLDSVMIRRPKELLGLKEPRLTYMPVKMNPDQAKLYRAAKFKIKEELKGTKAYNISQLGKLTRLRQITTDPFLVDSKASSIKIDILLDFLEEITSNNEKAIVYSIYRQETLKLKELLSDYNPAYIDGTLTALDAQDEVDKFQDNPSCKIMIGSLGACKESFTLTAARHVYFMDMSWTVTDNQQARDRAYRRGQNESVNVLIPYCEDTIDEKVLDILARDYNLIQEVVDGGSLILSRDTINYLLGDD